MWERSKRACVIYAGRCPSINVEFEVRGGVTGWWEEERATKEEGNEPVGDVGGTVRQKSVDTNSAVYASAVDPSSRLHLAAVYRTV